MTIYVLFHSECSGDSDIVGVYSTKELAEKYEKELDSKLSRLSLAVNYIEEYELDKEP